MGLCGAAEGHGYLQTPELRGPARGVVRRTLEGPGGRALEGGLEGANGERGAVRGGLCVFGRERQELKDTMEPGLGEKRLEAFGARLRSFGTRPERCVS